MAFSTELEKATYKLMKEHSELALTHKQVGEVGRFLFAAIINLIEEKGFFTIQNFGTFNVRERKAGKVKDPIKGKSHEYDSKKYLTFSGANALKDYLNLEDE